MNSIELIKQAFTTFLQQQFFLEQTALAGADITLNVDSQKQQFGDLSSNAALIIAKKVGKSPREVATAIAGQFSHNLIQKIEVAGPGFINIFLTKEAFKNLAQELFVQHDAFFKPINLVKKHYNIEFVSANPTGPLHLGHGRGGIIGDVLGNILTFLGYGVTKEFYINDAGAQIAKLGLSLRVRCEQQLGIPAEMPEEGYLGEYLMELAQRCISEFGDDVIKRDLNFFSTYAKDHLLIRIKQTLAAYGINFEVWFSEKTLHESGAIAEVLDFLYKHDFIYELDGAWWFKSTQFGDDKDRVVRRANGELTYVAADIAYLKNKLERGSNKLIMILGQDHHSYVVRLKAVLSALGYNPDDLDVILYQLVTLKESGELVRMSKRAGRIVSLEDVIETVGTDVARFFYLNRKADAHLEFDIELALKHTEENPVYYLQYAYVRTGSILEKAENIDKFTTINVNDIQGLTEHERLLLKKIVALKDMLSNMAHSYQTHVLTYYLLELAHLFHSYYAANKVLDTLNVEQSRARLLLVILLRRTFKMCLQLLGISCPDHM